MDAARRVKNFNLLDAVRMIQDDSSSAEEEDETVECVANLVPPLLVTAVSIDNLTYSTESGEAVESDPHQSLQELPLITGIESGEAVESDPHQSLQELPLITGIESGEAVESDHQSLQELPLITLIEGDETTQCVANRTSPLDTTVSIDNSTSTSESGGAIESDPTSVFLSTVLPDTSTSVLNSAMVADNPASELVYFPNLINNAQVVYDRSTNVYYVVTADAGMNERLSRATNPSTSFVNNQMLSELTRTAELDMDAHTPAVSVDVVVDEPIPTLSTTLDIDPLVPAMSVELDVDTSAFAKSVELDVDGPAPVISVDVPISTMSTDLDTDLLVLSMPSDSLTNASVSAVFTDPAINIPVSVVPTDNRSSISETETSVEQKGRKRCQPDGWIRNIVKKKRNLGQAYTSRSGKAVSERIFSDFECKCPLKCPTKCSLADRQHMHNLYYSSSQSAKLAFINGHVQQHTVARRYGKGDTSVRDKTRTYFFTVENGTQVRVCKKTFCTVIQLPSGTLDRALKREVLGTFEETRGKKEPANKSSPATVNAVIAHINSFPHYISHYCRSSSPNAKYLPQTLNLSLMYRMYVTDCVEKKSKPVGSTLYDNIFKKHFNLYFQQPKKDTCTKCDIYDEKIKCMQSNLPNSEPELSALIEERDQHQSRAEGARGCLVDDRRNAKDINCDCDVITFDLQSTLPTPRLSSNIVFYKRQLMVYNLGIHDCASETSTMNVWHEGEASRGAQEIGSCLQRYIKEQKRTSTKTELIAWSDSCGGQNRNIKMALTMLKLVSDPSLPYTTITQKFLESGHSFLPNDADFSDIEKRLKFHPHVYSPAAWYDIIREARCTNKRPFTVVEMADVSVSIDGNYFWSTKELEMSITNRKLDTDKNKISWLNAKQISVRRNKPKSLFFRYSHDTAEQWKEVDLNKRRTPASLYSIKQSVLFNGPRAIAAAKKRDILSLLNLIPPCYHDFYNSLPSDDRLAVESDVDGLPDIPDFIIEEDKD